MIWLKELDSGGARLLGGSYFFLCVIGTVIEISLLLEAEVIHSESICDRCHVIWRFGYKVLSDTGNLTIPDYRESLTDQLVRFLC
mgnify:CR=1 FL=1